MMNADEIKKAVEAVRHIISEEMRDQFSDAVIRYWLDPVYMGKIDRPDGFFHLAGICGDAMEFAIRVEKERIAEVKFSTDGCITSVAAGNMGAELTLGKTLREALMISPSDILEGLQGLPPENEHCAQLASETIKAAIGNYLERQQEPRRKDH